MFEKSHDTRTDVLLNPFDLGLAMLITHLTVLLAGGSPPKAIISSRNSNGSEATTALLLIGILATASAGHIRSVNLLLQKAAVEGFRV